MSRAPSPQEQLYLDEGKFRLDGQDHQEDIQFAGAGDVRCRRQGLDLLGGHAWVRGVEIHGMKKMLCGPFDESVCVIGDRSGWRIVHMLEDGIEHWPCVLGQIGHELTEFAVEVAKKQQSLFAQHRKARVVNRADGIFRLEQPRHQRWKLLGHRLCVRRRLQGKAERKVTLACHVTSFVHRQTSKFRRVTRATSATA